MIKTIFEVLGKEKPKILIPRKQIYNMEKEQKNFISWDFKESDTKEFTHVIHTYPAMMIPQIARRLIYLYGKNAKTILDPFMGSGTSLVEASLTPHIKEAYGYDLNPLAVLIAKVKTTPLDASKLDKTLQNLLTSKKHNGFPKFKNIEFWFKPEVIKKLAILKNSINEIKDKDVKDFFLVAFSETVRKVSNTRNGEFKLYRMAKKNLEEHNPNVFKEFQKIAEKNIVGIGHYVKLRNGTLVKPKIGNSMQLNSIKPQSIDLIVTSPPYGDSRTTVAYGQFSRLSSQWLDYEDANKLDNELLGGRPTKELVVNIESKHLREIIKKIAKEDSQRARDVLSFYEDFDKCLTQIDRLMAKGGHVCFVVGNRTVKGINIPTDKIMSEMFMAKGNYKHITTHLRAIPFKRMPKANSPTNEKGKTVTTMNNEFIFILQKV